MAGRRWKQNITAERTAKQNTPPEQDSGYPRSDVTTSKMASCSETILSTSGVTESAPVWWLEREKNGRGTVIRDDGGQDKEGVHSCGHTHRVASVDCCCSLNPCT